MTLTNNRGLKMLCNLVLLFKMILYNISLKRRISTGCDTTFSYISVQLIINYEEYLVQLKHNLVLWSHKHTLKHPLMLQWNKTNNCITFSTEYHRQVFFGNNMGFLLNEQCCKNFCGNHPIMVYYITADGWWQHVCQF